MPRRIATAVAIIALIATACSDSEETRTTVISEPVSRLVVTTDAGDIALVGNDQGATTVEALLSGFDDASVLTAEVIAGVLTVSHTCAKEGCSADYTISFDKAMLDVDMTSVSGNIVITDLEGNVTAKTASGDVFLNTITGIIEAESTSGGLLATRVRGATATFTSDSGDIDATFDEPVSSVTMTTSSGNAKIQLPGQPYRVISETTGSIDINIETDEAARGTISINAGTGDITIFDR